MASGTPDLPTCWSSMAVPNHAASIWWRSTPASFVASSKASTMRSSALASQRSPNFEQPMPRMTALSLIPVAMGSPPPSQRSVAIIHAGVTGAAFQKYRTNPRAASTSLMRNVMRIGVPTSTVPSSTSVKSAIIRPPPSNWIMP